MPIKNGKFHTYDSEYLTPDVIAVATRVEPKLTTTLDLFPEFNPVKSTKIEWFDAKTYALEGVVGAGDWASTGTTGLPISSELAQLVNVGDVLEVGGEQVVVKTVDRTASTIDVHARGHGSTTASSHIANALIIIIGSAHIEGVVEGDAIVTDTLKQVNYTQIIEEHIEITRTAQNAKKPTDIPNNLLIEQRVQAMTRALRKLNQAVLFGKPSEGSKITPRSFGGIKHFLETTPNAFNYNVGGTFTEAHLKNVLLEMSRRGGSPNTILCSPDIKSIINTFQLANTRYTRDERTAGDFVDRYEGEGVGTLDIVTDPFLRHSFGEMYILNTRKMGKSWYTNDRLRFATEPSNSRSVKETLQGQLTLKIKDVATDFARLNGIS